MIGSGIGLVDALVEFVQFCLHSGVGVGTAPGNGTSPAVVDWVKGIDRLRTSREIAVSLFIVFTPSVKWLETRGV